MYEQSCKLIYDMISQRLVYRRKHLGLRYADIHPDANMLCAIAHNRRHPKKNLYLLPERALWPESHGEGISQIAKHLGFNSDNELIWGNYYEQQAYSGELFKALLADSLVSDDQTIANEVYAILEEYIPFGQSRFYADFCANYRGEIPIEYLIKETDRTEYLSDYDFYKNTAIARLYGKIQCEFAAAFNSFHSAKSDTLKLDKALGQFFKTEVLPLIRSTITDDSIGTDVKTIMLRNQERVSKIENQSLRWYPELWGHEPEAELWRQNIAIPVFKAAQEYVCALAQIQKENEPPVHPLHKEWQPEMSLLTYTAQPDSKA